MSRFTRYLIRIVENRAGEPNTWSEAQVLIATGADITAPTKNGSMIHSVIAQERRYRQTTPWKADNCQYLIQVLQKRASDLLIYHVLSSNVSTINDISRFITLHANTYQADTFGPLGLLGELLKQDKVEIQLAVVRQLVEGDPLNKAGLMAGDEYDQSCLSLARNNSKCPKEVIDYLQCEFDKILNKVSFTRPPINVDEVTAWIRRGANTEAIDEKHNTALTNAVLTNNLDLVHVLVSCGANTAHVNADKLTPLDIAKNATPKNPPLIAILESQTLNVELRKLIENKKSHLTINDVNNLLTNGANINALTANNNSLLHVLITSEGTPDMVTTFINEFNADITITNISGHRALETCILFDKEPFSILKAFVKQSKVLTSMFFNQNLNKSLLQFAIEQNRPGAVKVIEYELNQRLWVCVAQANSKNEHNQNVMAEMKQLIDYGAQINHKYSDKDHKEWTVLHLACRATTKDFVQSLIKQMKADYLVQNHNGDYPIAIAAEHGQLSIVQYLLELFGSKLNVSNKDQQTPLHLATKNHHILVVRFLIRWGADHQAQNLAKQTALDIAMANVSNRKEDQLSDKQLIAFLEQLKCPVVDITDTTKNTGSIKPKNDLDTCVLVTTITVKPIQIVNTDPDGLGNRNKGFLSDTPNNNLYNAAKDGNMHALNVAIDDGADICYRKGNHTAYQMAYQIMAECHAKMNPSSLNYMKSQEMGQRLYSYQQIISTIQRIAQTKIIEAIDKSDAGLVMAYHLAGAVLTPDLLYRTCSTSDNIEIVDYLIRQSHDVWEATVNFTSPHSPYRIAKKKKYHTVASYLKFILSMKCTEAVKENNLPYMKSLVCAGASVDMHDTNNLLNALEHQNIEMIQILCDNGAIIPAEWLENTTFMLSADISRTMSPEIAQCINHCLINRRLRFLAASGDLNGVIHCQRLGADINSMNCHGSTALLCAIQHGNYFSIVHTLVSSGTSILHSNDDEPISLIDLAKSRQYNQIAAYLTKELNAQFVISILNNDQNSAQKYSELGVEFNYQDEQKRTALHYAVQYHGIDLVKWLCDCGSSPMIADINGDYPIIQAIEKGKLYSHWHVCH
jgi:ankyrin repeat protein